MHFEDRRKNEGKESTREEIYCERFYDALRFMFIDDLIIIFCQKDARIGPHDFYEVFFNNKKGKIPFLPLCTPQHNKSKEFLHLLLQD